MPFNLLRRQSKKSEPSVVHLSPTRGPNSRKESIPISMTAARKNPDEAYKIIKTLGEGSFGICYLVEAVEDKAMYVLKRMKCTDKEEMLEALKEMVMMRICASPFSVLFKEFYKDEEKLEVVLVMEFCEEGDLFQRLKAAHENKTRLPEEQILRWFTQILLGLDAIHSKQFLHRDIKPGNIFLGRWDVVKLGDFGLGTLLARNDQESKQGVAGTPGFMAPEIAAGLPYNSKSDVYALGCTLYEMLTLRSAYYDTKKDLFPQPLPQGYSDQIADLLLSLLTPNPKFRPSVKDVLEDPLIKERAEAMRHEQDLLQRVMKLEERIGYKHHERRKSAFRAYFPSLKAGAVAKMLAGGVSNPGTGRETKITDVESEWNKMVAEAKSPPSTSADEFGHSDAAISGVSTVSSAPSQSVSDERVKILQGLRAQIEERKKREEELESRVQEQTAKIDKLGQDAAAAAEKDEEIASLALELAELRDRNAVYELLMNELNDQISHTATPGGPDSVEIKKASDDEDEDDDDEVARVPDPAADDDHDELLNLRHQIVEVSQSQRQLQLENERLKKQLAMAQQSSNVSSDAGSAPDQSAASAPAVAAAPQQQQQQRPIQPPTSPRKTPRVCSNYTEEVCSIM